MNMNNEHIIDNGEQLSFSHNLITKFYLFNHDMV